MNPSEIKELLGAMGTRPKKGLGQHFLVDPSVIHAALNAAHVKKGDRVLEVGPGLGVLTTALLDAGADVIAIEQDRAFAEMLGATYHDRSLHVVQGDAATVHWHEFVGDEPWKFISNLPYAITSLALRKALYTPRPPEVVVVLIQKEVAERAAGGACPERSRRGQRATGRKTSLLSLMVALASASSRIVRKVPPKCFYPSPKVQSVLFEIVPMSIRDREKKWGMDPEDVMKVAKVGFAHPRKLVASNLAGYAGARFIAPTKSDIEHILESIGVNTKARAEDLVVDNWVSLANEIRKHS